MVGAGPPVELVRAKGGWHEAGTDMRPSPEIERERLPAGRDDVLVLKEAGRHYYGGQGRPWLYAGAQYRVYRVVEDRGETMLCGRLAVFGVRQYPKKGA